MDPCITKPFDSTSGSSEILDFYRAYQLQRVLLTRKSKMCQEPLPYKKLKKLVEESGKNKNRKGKNQPRFQGLSLPPFSCSGGGGRGREKEYLGTRLGKDAFIGPVGPYLLPCFRKGL